MQVLVSVNSVPEAQIVLSAGVDLIDLKDTSHGALAALDLEQSRHIIDAIQQYQRQHADHPILISGTIGDDAVSAETLAGLIEQRLAIGMHIIKLSESIWAHPALKIEIERYLKAGTRLIAVLAPQSLQHPLSMQSKLEYLSQAGYFGVMVDTTDKSGALLAQIALGDILMFVDSARARDLFVGVAGGLKLAHVNALADSGADYLGFRGGVCRNGVRSAALDAGLVAQVLMTVANLSVSQ